jgi:hypothetical protein
MSDVSLLRQHGLLMRLVSIDQHTSNLNAERFLTGRSTSFLKQHSHYTDAFRWLRYHTVAHVSSRYRTCSSPVGLAFRAPLKPAGADSGGRMKSYLGTTQLPLEQHETISLYCCHLCLSHGRPNSQLPTRSQTIPDIGLCNSISSKTR